MAVASAIIGGALALGGAALSSSASNRASRRAQDASNYAADRSAEVLQRNYDLSATALRPWQQSGLAANALLNDFYGIQVPQQAPQTPPQMGGLGGLGGLGAGVNWNGINLSNILQNGGATAPSTPPPTTPAPNSQDAFRRFIQNSDYGFQFGEGANRVNSGYAGAGTLKSGAAMRALEDYRQNLQQGYRGEYLSGLANQQGVGFGAASAQAGVSQNLGNSLANVYANQGANNANAILSRGGSGIGNALSGLGGFLLGGR